jgi:O-antigen/teichoic acid export membrane protein
VLGARFSPKIAGFYAMADIVVRKPLLIAGMSIRKEYLQKAAEIKNRGLSLWGSLSKITLGLAILGILPFGLLLFFGADILRIFLGEQWGVADYYVRILAPWYFAVWMTSAAQTTLTVLRKRALWLKLQIGVLVARLIKFAVAYL